MVALRSFLPNQVLVGKGVGGEDALQGIREDIRVVPVVEPPFPSCAVLPLSSVGEMTLRLDGALSYSQNSARDLRCALNGA